MARIPDPPPLIAALPLSASLPGMALVLFAVVVWSGWIVASRHSVVGILTPYDITALRFGVSGILLMPFLIRRGFRVGPHGILGGLAVMAMMGAPYNTIAVEGMRFAPASHASAVINACMLLGSYTFGRLMLKERVGGMQYAGIACCLAGIGLILLAKPAAGIYEHSLRGHFLFAFAGFIWGAYSAFNRAWRLDPLHATAAICGYSLLCFLPFYFLSLSGVWPAFSGIMPVAITRAPLGETIFQGLYQGVLNSVFALLAYNRGIAILGATRASAFIPLVPVFSTLLAIPVLGEHPGPMEWAGVATVAFGVLLACGILRILQQRLAL